MNPSETSVEVSGLSTRVGLYIRVVPEGHNASIFSTEVFYPDDNNLKNENLKFHSSIGCKIEPLYKLDVPNAYLYIGLSM
jgi:hypothetical protein